MISKSEPTTIKNFEELTLSSVGVDTLELGPRLHPVTDQLHGSVNSFTSSGIHFVHLKCVPYSVFSISSV